MQNSGIRQDQITQVRGFADQRLRKPDAPLDPSNRRISMIVQYLNKPSETSSASQPSEKVAAESPASGQGTSAPKE
jgi:chemotaxis protein MotB